MGKTIVKKEYSCLLFGEGGKDKHFLNALSCLSKFAWHTKKWEFILDNGSGGSPGDVLKKCKATSAKASYDLVICFIDLDKLKDDFPLKWEREKNKLEKEYSNFKIIWQVDKLEDELKRVLGNKYISKHRLNKLAQRDIDKFVNSGFYKRILAVIKDREINLRE